MAAVAASARPRRALGSLVTPERWKRLRAAIEAAREAPSSAGRDAALVQACADDTQLLSEARSIMRAAHDTSAFLGPLGFLTTEEGDATAEQRPPLLGRRLGHLEEIHHRVSAGGATLSKLTYAYDAVGNITLWTQQYGASAANAYDLKYDGADQLVSATYRTTDPTPVTLKRYGYAYDPAGNRTTEQIDEREKVSKTHLTPRTTR